jgi:hypothetical protein
VPANENLSVVPQAIYPVLFLCLRSAAHFAVSAIA